MTTTNDTPVIETKPRRRAMLWEELGGKREPEFDNGKGHPKVYILCDNRNPEIPGYAVGTLAGVNLNATGKTYHFRIVSTDGVEDLSYFTHFCEPVMP